MTWVALLVIFFLMVPVATSFISTLGAQGSNTISVGQSETQVWIANASGDYQIAGATVSGGQISITTPTNFTLEHMVVFTANPHYDVEKFVNGSYFSYNMNVKTAETGNAHTNLTTANIVAGSIYNSSSKNALSDKNILGLMNIPVFNGRINNLNMTEKLGTVNTFLLASTSGTDYVGYILNFNTSIAKGTTSSTITVTLTSTFSNLNNLTENFYIFSIVFEVVMIIPAGLMLVKSYINQDSAVGKWGE